MPKTIEMKVEKYANTTMPVLKFTNVNCAKLGIKKPKLGDKIKVIYDWG